MASCLLITIVEALRRLLLDVPVVMITAHGNIDTYSKAFKLGIFEYINKSVNTGEFRRIVKFALGKGMQVSVPAVREGRIAHPDQ